MEEAKKLNNLELSHFLCHMTIIMALKIQKSTGKFQFIVEVPKINKLGCKLSQKVVFQGIPWQIKVVKDDGDEPSLGVYLQCNKNNRNNWEHPASVKIRMLSFGDSADDVEYFVDPYAFCKGGNTFGISSLIVWDDLFATEKNYVKNDAIKLKIEIEAADPNDDQKSVLQLENLTQNCDACCSTKKRFTITNIGNLMAVGAPSFRLRNISLKFIIFKMSPAHLGFHILFEHDLLHPCVVNLQAKLKSSIPKGNVTKRFITTLMEDDVTEFQLISWEHLMNTQNGLIRDNRIVIELKIEIPHPVDPSEEDDSSSDENGSKIEEEDAKPEEQNATPEEENATQEEDNTTIEGDNALPENVDSSSEEGDAKRSKFECVICSKRFQQNAISTNSCGHIFCTTCVKASMKCPVCKAVVAAN